jgi:hypothetical protein
MHHRLRAALAAAVIAHSSGRQVGSIYDHEADERLPLQAQAMGARVACYDETSELRLTGELPDLVRLPEGTAIHLQVEDGDYRGFDHGSETHFNVRRDGLTAQVYDHGDRHWFSYTAHPATF